MQLDSLKSEFDKLQLQHGEPTLDPVYGAGQTHKPKVCLIFMNPTARNISSQKDWGGLKAPWIGTKHIWKMLSRLGLFPQTIVEEIYERKGKEWDNDFAQKVYTIVKNRNLYITSLAKCTQLDARHLKNSTFRKYLKLMKEEIDLIKPNKIITFGNQVSSIFLGKTISVSKTRKTEFKVKISGNNYKTYPVYYPVGQGMRNIDKAIEDVKYIMKPD